MAGRPSKNTVDYFPHYINHGKTMQILTTKYGNNGKAFWWTLLEILGGSENHFYDCNNTFNWEFLLSKTLLDDISATEILNTLASLEAIDPEFWTIKVIWCQKFVDNIEGVYRKRGADKPQRPEYLLQKYKVTDISATENTQSIVEYSIGEEIKVENKKPSCSAFKKAERKVSYSDDDMRLSKLLDSLMLQNNPNRKEPTEATLRSWANEFRLMRERDKRTAADIEAVLRWSQNDSFWKTNVESVGKLRKKFDQLSMKMKSTPQQKGVDHAEEWNNNIDKRKYPIDIE